MPDARLVGTPFRRAVAFGWQEWTRVAGEFASKRRQPKWAYTSYLDAEVPRGPPSDRPCLFIDRMWLRLTGTSSDDLVFTAPRGGPLRANEFRRRVFNHAAEPNDIPDLVATPCETPLHHSPSCGSVHKGRPADTWSHLSQGHPGHLGRPLRRRPRTWPARSTSVNG